MPSPPADVAAAPFTPSSVQELEYDEVRFTIVRASVATVVAAILFRWTGERGDLNFWQLIAGIVAGALFVAACHLWLPLLPAETGDDRWMDAPIRRRTTFEVTDWATARYGDIGGLGTLRRYRRFRKAKHERLIWRTTAWVPSERDDGKGWNLRDVELRFDADGTPRLIDVHYSTPEQELPIIGASA